MRCSLSFIEKAHFDCERGTPISPTSWVQRSSQYGIRSEIHTSSDFWTLLIIESLKFLQFSVTKCLFLSFFDIRIKLFEKKIIIHFYKKTLSRSTRGSTINISKITDFQILNFSKVSMLLIVSLDSQKINFSY